MVTISFIHYSENKWWAFKQMRLLPPEIEKVEGVIFSKLLGTGSGFGFSLKPDFSTYSLLIKWKDETTKDQFFNSHKLFQELVGKSKTIKTYLLEELGAHGSWYGANPFEEHAAYDGNQIAIITRARINVLKLPRFWSNVPKASKAIKEAKGLVFTKGVGEWPLIEQATFSIWENMEAMKNYAYQDTHKEIIKRVKQENWYKEELFARFNVKGSFQH
jgi:heme-degrading monooxygenase HmoA